MQSHYLNIYLENNEKSDQVEVIREMDIQETNEFGKRKHT